MIVGIPREIKDHEFRVAATPGAVETLVQAGHRVLLERGRARGAALRMPNMPGAGPRSCRPPTRSGSRPRRCDGPTW